MKIRFILNPQSGHLRRRPGVDEEIRCFIAARRLDATVELTARSGHATELATAALAEGCQVVVAVGGDGTMNEVARALTGTEATLGLVPCGSGNGLARHLGIPLNFSDALAHVLDGEVRCIDTGLAAGHPFFCAAGLGFEAEIAAKFNRLNNRGFLRYLLTSAGAYWRYAPLSCDIESVAGRQSVRALTLVVANCRQYGNNAIIAPGAILDDGLLNLTAVPPVNLFAASAMVWRLFRGTLRNSKSVTMLTGNKFTVDCPMGGLLHTDGETHAIPAKVEFSVRPASLRIIAPPVTDSTR